MLKNRLMTAAILIPCFLAALFYLSDVVWAILMLLIALIGLHEWTVLKRFSKGMRWGYLAISAGLGATGVYYGNVYGGHAFFDLTLRIGLLVSGFWLLVIPFWLRFKFKLDHIVTAAILGWFLMLPLWLSLVCLKIANPWLLLSLLALIWIADSAAYFAGRAFGKNKLATAISPGKTWEGAIGAALAVSLYAIALSQYVGTKTWLVWAGAMLILILSIMGDLFESLVKRQANMKDSGTLLPGHGGVLDRVDSLIPTMPIALLLIYFYLQFQHVV